MLTYANAAALGFSTIVPQQFGRPVFGPDRLNPIFDNIYEWQNESSSTYHGIAIALNRRLANEVEFSGSYTLSKTLDDASDFNEQPQNPYALAAERGLSLNDQRASVCVQRYIRFAVWRGAGRQKANRTGRKAVWQHRSRADSDRRERQTSKSCGWYRR
jgi:hypothetical protein